MKCPFFVFKSKLTTKMSNLAKVAAYESLDYIGYFGGYKKSVGSHILGGLPI